MRDSWKLLRPSAIFAFAAAARASTAAAAEPSGGDEPVEEVHVRGRKTGEPTAPRTSLSARDVREVPGAFGDAFRALDSSPGVTPIASGLPYFFVRGAPPGNTGFFIDGVRVPGLFHLGVGPAVMYPAFIESVDLYKGAYPVSFGRFAGGIVSADTAAPAQRRRADWTLRLFDAGALVEAPFGPHTENELAPGSATFSGRYGYPGLLVSAFAPDTGLSYWDYQSRIAYRLSERDTASVFAFGSYDSLSTRDRDDEPLSEVLSIQFHRVDLRWDRRTSATGALRTAVTVGYDRTASDAFSAQSFLGGARSIYQERVSDAVRIRAGADAWAQRYRFRVGRDGDEASDGERAPNSLSAGVQTDVNLAVWADAPLVIAPRAEITPGLRADVFTSRGIGSAAAIPSLDPRVTTRVGFDRFTHVAAVGLAHQPSTIPLPVPALTFAQLSRGLQGGYHMSQGLEVDLPEDVTASATAYLHAYTGLADLVSPCDSDDDPRCEENGTRGRSVGLELMVRRKLGKRVGGWVSYTLSRSTRDAYDPRAASFRSVPSAFDRTHVVSAVVSVDLGRGWRAGGRYTGYSGVPYSTVSAGAVPDARTPAFNRLDLRVEKRWIWQNGRRISLTAEMFNVLFSEEAVGVRCEEPGGCEPELIGPIAIPSIGVEGTL